MDAADVLEAAREAVADRAVTYGQPRDNFVRIARRWNAHLVNRYGPFGPVPEMDPVDVAIMLDDVKSARLERAPNHIDSWIDKAGYAACGAEVAECEDAE